MQFIRSLAAVAATLVATAASAQVVTTQFSGLVAPGNDPFDVLATSINILATSNVTGGVASSSYSANVPVSFGGMTVNVNLTASALTLQSVYLKRGTTLIASDTDLTDGFSFSNLTAGTYSLFITGRNSNTMLGGLYAGTTTTSVAAAVPEPESIALVLAGLGVVGFVSRRRRIG